MFNNVHTMQDLMFPQWCGGELKSSGSWCWVTEHAVTNISYSFEGS